MAGRSPSGDDSAAPRVRLDQALVRRGLARSRTSAQELIRAGRVRVGGQPADKVSHLVDPGVEISADVERYVSRGAHKLLGALADLGLTLPGGRALDAGASTGGFTQVLLEQGYDPVFAVDVGTDQLVPSLRADPRVVVREHTNLRSLTLADLDACPVDLVAADVSFISLTALVGVFGSVAAPGGQALLLVKPQFEVGRRRLGKNGIVRSADDRRAAVDGVAAAATAAGWLEVGRVPSRLVGAGGNQEYVLHLTRRS